MAKKRWLSSFCRHPKTTQELRANQEKNSPYVRGKRKNLPSFWDDQVVEHQNSWKYLRRKHQYREEKKNYSWHEFYYSFQDIESRTIANNYINHLIEIGCFYEYIRGGIKWFGPPLGDK